MSEYRKGSHTVYRLHYHFVFLMNAVTPLVLTSMIHDPVRQRPRAAIWLDP